MALVAGRFAVRLLALAQGARGVVDIGPHALSISCLGPVVAVQAGGGLRDTVHLVLTHESGAASTVTLSHTVAPLSTGIEFFVHRDAGRLVLLPESGSAEGAFSVAVGELTAAAVTGERILRRGLRAGRRRGAGCGRACAVVGVPRASRNRDGDGDGVTFSEWFVCRGRISRHTWWLRYTLPIAGLAILAELADASLGHGHLRRVRSGRRRAWAGVEHGDQPAHRRPVDQLDGGPAARQGRTRWWLLVLLPLVGVIVLLVQNGFLRGDGGPNRYGLHRAARAHLRAEDYSPSAADISARS